MKIVYLDENNELLEDSCVAIGFFDGMHIGHQTLFKEVINKSNALKLKKGVMTFNKHPRSLISNDPFHYIASLKDKIDYFEELDFDYMFIILFNEETCHLSYDAFIENYLIKNKVKYVVCGFDFHFGYKGEGNTEILKQYYPDHLTVIEKQIYKDKKISSTYIRECMDEGNIELANQLLGTEYTLKGAVIKGRQIGRTIGFPTANVAYKDYYLPRNGVYGVRVELDGHKYLGMANIGYNPTFNALDHKSLEINIFDFKQDIYGRILKVSFLYYIRPETKFSSKEELIKQLKQDQSEIRSLGLK